MKTLTLLRHAKSSWDDPVSRDFDRPLNRRGRRAARTVGQALKARGFAPDLVLASPAVRVVETLDELGEALGRPLDTSFDRRIYLAEPQTLLELVQEAGGSADHLLLVGHNPGLERLALLLTADGGPLRSELAIKYPTGTVAQIALDVASWRDVAAGTGRLAAFIRPRDLDPELGPED
jgi:phosphohistidine phosphatase